MKVALIGYGKMGHEIEVVLRERGHDVALIIDVNNQDDFVQENFKGVDVAIEFTSPHTAFDNVRRCLEWGIPVVSGSTGWNEKMEEAENLCEEKGGTFFYASNYSIGVNIFFRLNEYLANIMNAFEEYDVAMREVHHTQKVDAPSGTAVTLAEHIIGCVERKQSWVNHETANPKVLGIVSVREGEVPGIHEVRYESAADSIELIHTAKNRSGFALGAVLAAEFASRNKGVLTMKDLLKF